MLIVRPVTFADIQALEQLAVVAGGSMSTLPANRDHLSELIGATQRALRTEVTQPNAETYHFVLEESATGEVLGVSGINAAVGLESPFYSYRIDQVVHASSDLQIHNRIPALHLCQDHTGSSSLCSLFLAPQHRSAENLQLLSRARMLFMACHRHRFADRTLAELQGVLNEQSKSPFWEALGRHFFSMEFSRANYLTGIQSKSFIADLMPHYPVYVPLLPESAQAVIAKSRPDIEPIRTLLESEGFEARGYIDIFDAGPTLENRTDQIRSLRDSRLLTPVCDGALTSDSDNPPQAAMALVSNTELASFRCLLTQFDRQQPFLSDQAVHSLGVARGEAVRTHPLDL
ncbi:MAG: arginine N-succinyltransferase [Motiliproteus sp.]|jgi:arginine N-succinyltransferase